MEPTQEKILQAQHGRKSVDEGISQLGSARQQTQKKTFGKWVNSVLPEVRKINGQEVKVPRVQNVEEDLCDGVILVHLLEELTGKSVKKHKSHPRMRLHKMQNISIVLDFLTHCGVKVVGLPAVEIVDGNLKIILGLLWTIILKFQVLKHAEVEEETSDHGTRVSPTKALLEWCKTAVSNTDLQVNNFSSSFQDGRVLCALIDRYRPGVLNLSSLKAEDGLDNLALAFKLAHEYFDIPYLLDPEDFIPGPPDEHVVVVYVSSFRARVSQGNQEPPRRVSGTHLELPKTNQTSMERDRRRSVSPRPSPSPAAPSPATSTAEVGARTPSTSPPPKVDVKATKPPRPTQSSFPPAEKPQESSSSAKLDAIFSDLEAALKAAIVSKHCTKEPAIRVLRGTEAEMAAAKSRLRKLNDSPHITKSTLQMQVDMMCRKFKALVGTVRLMAQNRAQVNLEGIGGLLDARAVILEADGDLGTISQTIDELKSVQDIIQEQEHCLSMMNQCRKKCQAELDEMSKLQNSQDAASPRSNASHQTPRRSSRGSSVASFTTPRGLQFRTAHTEMLSEIVADMAQIRDADVKMEKVLVNTPRTSRPNTARGQTNKPPLPASAYRVSDDFGLAKDMVSDIRRLESLDKSMAALESRLAGEKQSNRASKLEEQRRRCVASLLAEKDEVKRVEDMMEYLESRISLLSTFTEVVDPRDLSDLRSKRDQVYQTLSSYKAFLEQALAEAENAPPFTATLDGSSTMDDSYEAPVFDFGDLKKSLKIFEDKLQSVKSTRISPEASGLIRNISTLQQSVGQRVRSLEASVDQDWNTVDNLLANRVPVEDVLALGAIPSLNTNNSSTNGLKSSLSELRGRVREIESLVVVAKSNKSEMGNLVSLGASLERDLNHASSDLRNTLRGASPASISTTSTVTAHGHTPKLQTTGFGGFGPANEYINRRTTMSFVIDLDANIQALREILQKVEHIVEEWKKSEAERQKLGGRYASVIKDITEIYSLLHLERRSIYAILNSELKKKSGGGPQFRDLLNQLDQLEDVGKSRGGHTFSERKRKFSTIWDRHNATGSPVKDEALNKSVQSTLSGWVNKHVHNMHEVLELDTYIQLQLGQLNKQSALSPATTVSQSVRDMSAGQVERRVRYVKWSLLVEILRGSQTEFRGLIEFGTLGEEQIQHLNNALSELKGKISSLGREIPKLQSNQKFRDVARAVDSLASSASKVQRPLDNNIAEFKRKLGEESDANVESEQWAREMKDFIEKLNLTEELAEEDKDANADDAMEMRKELEDGEKKLVKMVEGEKQLKAQRERAMLNLVEEIAHLQRLQSDADKNLSSLISLESEVRREDNQSYSRLLEELKKAKRLLEDESRVRRDVSEANSELMTQVDVLQSKLASEYESQSLESLERATRCIFRQAKDLRAKLSPPTLRSASTEIEAVSTLRQVRLAMKKIDAQPPLASLDGTPGLSSTFGDEVNKLAESSPPQFARHFQRVLDSAAAVSEVAEIDSLMDALAADEHNSDSDGNIALVLAERLRILQLKIQFESFVNKRQLHIQFAEALKAAVIEGLSFLHSNVSGLKSRMACVGKLPENENLGLSEVISQFEFIQEEVVQLETSIDKHTGDSFAEMINRLCTTPKEASDQIMADLVADVNHLSKLAAEYESSQEDERKEIQSKIQRITAHLEENENAWIAKVDEAHSGLQEMESWMHQMVAFVKDIGIVILESEQTMEQAEEKIIQHLEERARARRALQELIASGETHLVAKLQEVSHEWLTHAQARASLVSNDVHAWIGEEEKRLLELLADVEPEAFDAKASPSIQAVMKQFLLDNAKLGELEIRAEGRASPGTPESKRRIADLLQNARKKREADLVSLVEHFHKDVYANGTIGAQLVSHLWRLTLLSRLNAELSSFGENVDWLSEASEVGEHTECLRRLLSEIEPLRMRMTVSNHDASSKFEYELSELVRQLESWQLNRVVLELTATTRFGASGFNADVLPEGTDMDMKLYNLKVRLQNSESELLVLKEAEDTLRSTSSNLLIALDDAAKDNNDISNSRLQRAEDLLNQNLMKAANLRQERRDWIQRHIALMTISTVVSNTASDTIRALNDSASPTVSRVVGESRARGSSEASDISATKDTAEDLKAEELRLKNSLLQLKEQSRALELREAEVNRQLKYVRDAQYTLEENRSQLEQRFAEGGPGSEDLKRELDELAAEATRLENSERNLGKELSDLEQKSSSLAKRKTLAESTLQEISGDLNIITPRNRAESLRHRAVSFNSTKKTLDESLWFVHNQIFIDLELVSREMTVFTSIFNPEATRYSVRRLASSLINSSPALLRVKDQVVEEFESKKKACSSSRLRSLRDEVADTRRRIVDSKNGQEDAKTKDELAFFGRLLEDLGEVMKVEIQLAKLSQQAQTASPSPDAKKANPEYIEKKLRALAARIEGQWSSGSEQSGGTSRLIQELSQMVTSCILRAESEAADLDVQCRSRGGDPSAVPDRQELEKCLRECRTAFEANQGHVKANFAAEEVQKQQLNNVLAELEMLVSMGEELERKGAVVSSGIEELREAAISKKGGGISADRARMLDDLVSERGTIDLQTKLVSSKLQDVIADVRNTRYELIDISEQRKAYTLELAGVLRGSQTAVFTAHAISDSLKRRDVVVDLRRQADRQIVELRSKSLEVRHLLTKCQKRVRRAVLSVAESRDLTAAERVAIELHESNLVNRRRSDRSISTIIKQAEAGEVDAALEPLLSDSFRRGMSKYRQLMFSSTKPTPEEVVINRYMDLLEEVESTEEDLRALADVARKSNQRYRRLATESLVAVKISCHQKILDAKVQALLWDPVLNAQESDIPSSLQGFDLDKTSSSLDEVANNIAKIVDAEPENSEEGSMIASLSNIALELKQSLDMLKESTEEHIGRRSDAQNEWNDARKALAGALSQLESEVSHRLVVEDDLAALSQRNEDDHDLVDRVASALEDRVDGAMSHISELCSEVATAHKDLVKVFEQLRNDLDQARNQKSSIEMLKTSVIDEESRRLRMENLQGQSVTAELECQLQQVMAEKHRVTLEKDQRIEELKQKVAAADQAKEASDSVAATARADIAKVEDEKKSVEEALLNLELEKNQTISELRQRIAALDTERAKLSGEVLEKEEELNKMQSERARLEQGNLRLETTMRRMTIDVESEQDRSRKFYDDLKALDNRLQAENDSKESLSRELEQLREERDSILRQKAAAEDNVISLRDRVDDLVHELEQQRLAADGNLAGLQPKLKRLDFLEKKTLSLERQLEDSQSAAAVQAEVNALKDAKNELATKLDQKSDKLAATEAAIEHQQSVIDALKDQNDKYLADLANLRSSTRVADHTKEELEAELTEIKVNQVVENRIRERLELTTMQAKLNNDFAEVGRTLSDEAAKLGQEISAAANSVPQAKAIVYWDFVTALAKVSESSQVGYDSILVEMEPVRSALEAFAQGDMNGDANGHALSAMEFSSLDQWALNTVEVLQKAALLESDNNDVSKAAAVLADYDGPEQDESELRAMVSADVQKLSRGIDMLKWEVKAKVISQREMNHEQEMFSLVDAEREDLVLIHFDLTSLEEDVAIIQQDEGAAPPEIEDGLAQLKARHTETNSNVEDALAQVRSKVESRRHHKEKLHELLRSLQSIHQELADIEREQVREGSRPGTPVLGLLGGEVQSTNPRIAALSQEAKQIEKLLADELAMDRELRFQRGRDVLSLLRETKHMNEMKAQARDLKTRVSDVKQELERGYLEQELADELRQQYEGDLSSLRAKMLDLQEKYDKVGHSPEPAPAAPKPKKTPVPRKKSNIDEVEMFLEKYLLDTKLTELIPENFTKIDGGKHLYNFGTKRITLTVMNAELSVRVGGGYMPFGKYVEKYGKTESQKYESLFRRSVKEKKPEQARTVSQFLEMNPELRQLGK